jgi:hypothetical protein
MFEFDWESENDTDLSESDSNVYEKYYSTSLINGFLKNFNLNKYKLIENKNNIIKKNNISKNSILNFFKKKFKNKKEINKKNNVIGVKIENFIKNNLSFGMSKLNKINKKKNNNELKYAKKIISSPESDTIKKIKYSIDFDEIEENDEDFDLFTYENSDNQESFSELYSNIFLGDTNEDDSDDSDFNYVLFYRDLGDILNIDYDYEVFLKNNFFDFKKFENIKKNFDFNVYLVFLNIIKKYNNSKILKQVNMEEKIKPLKIYYDIDNDSLDYYFNTFSDKINKQNEMYFNYISDFNKKNFQHSINKY